MIHGDRSQAQRNKALSGFQEGYFQVLVATDIAARGLHVDDVAHVINYDVPKSAEDFIHRVGRTGRAGSQGRATTLVAGGEVIELRQLNTLLSCGSTASSWTPPVRSNQRGLCKILSLHGR